MIKAIEIIKEMMEVRKYTIISETKDRIFATKIAGERMVCMLDCINCKFGIDNIKQKIDQLNADEIKHCIIVYNDVPTSAVKNTIIDLEKTGKQIELFHIDDLQYNCTKHSLVPKHSALELKESITFKKKYGTNLQVILHNDPIARFYNFRPGNIIKIVRKDGCPTYRIVK